ncbi:MAG TPA: winged helix-turn-helix domain-containing protein [Verrucomicrobiae bacterium]|nr:winged helix-turn-helix domain-containing protein [Verrucomicrobiae bacterium]
MSDESGQRAAPQDFRDSRSVAKETLSQETPRLYEFGPYRLDPAERKLLRDNEIVALTPKAFDTLLLLVRNSGHLLKKDELINSLWPETFVEEGSLSNNIFLLRKALGEDPAFIETVPRRGYRFVGAVRQFPDGPPTRAEKPSEGGAPAVVSIPSKARLGSRTAVSIAAVVLLVASLAATGWFYKWPGRGGEKIDSLAVLPFLNSTADPNTEYLSDGITESLINSLSQLPNLRVTSRDSFFRYKGKETDPQTVGREFGVRAIFKGRVTQRGDTLNISVELINARDSSHIWGQQYDRKLADMVALREEIAREMASALRVRLTGAEEKRLTKSYTTNPEAYQDYLKGHYWLKKRTEEGFSKGIEYFRQAIAKDPSYALAYAGLSDAYCTLADFGLVSGKDGYLKAKDAALKALELDDTLAEAHSALALIKSSYDWDWSGADREVRRAIELNPSYVDAHRLHAVVLWQTGRLDEAIAETKRTLVLDPLSLPNNLTLGIEFFLARQYDRAIEQEGKLLELDPNFILAYYFRGVSYVKKSMYTEAMGQFEKGISISPANIVALTGLGYGYAVTGKRVEAQKVLDKMNDISKQKHVSAVFMAKIYAGLQDKEKAFEWLEKAYEDRSIVSVGFVKTNPMFDPLRSDPRFIDLLRRTNLQP